MPQAVMFSVPEYILDSGSIATVVGYNVQGTSTIASNGMPSGWTAIPGSPFSSNLNIVDTSGDASHTKLYQVQPVLQVTQNDTTYTLDVPWSDPFTAGKQLYSFELSTALLPLFRSTYMADEGVPQSNGTQIMENTGPGQGLWTPNGTNKRFPLQYVENDDPVRVLEKWYNLTWYNSAGESQSSVPWTDYMVDTENGVVEFATAPAATDYLRFDFRECSFSNERLLRALQTAVYGLSEYGINGYYLTQSNNLLYMGHKLPDLDLGDIICRLAQRNIRAGLTELAMRTDANWRDGGASYDPQPNRNLQFLVQAVEQDDQHIRRLANGWIRSNTRPLYRGDFDVMFDMSQMSPVSVSMFEQFSSFTGYAGVGLSPGFAMAFWV